MTKDWFLANKQTASAMAKFKGAFDQMHTAKVRMEVWDEPAETFRALKMLVENLQDAVNELEKFIPYER